MESEIETGYEMEELIPLVARLAEKYTGFESSSISYERAQQLMEAVLYCIREYKEFAEADWRAGTTDLLRQKERISAADAYQRGYDLVIRKARAANELYAKIMENFCDYGNRAYRDTMQKEMPEFFLRYDARFAPQDELLLLAYPVLRPLEGLYGIDRIYEYLRCIRKEQEFLRSFPEEYVRKTCEAYHEDYEELFISISEIMMT